MNKYIDSIHENIIYYSTAWSDNKSFIGIFLWDKGELILTDKKLIFYRKFLLSEEVIQITLNDISSVKINNKIYETKIIVSSSGSLNLEVLLPTQKIATTMLQEINKLI